MLAATNSDLEAAIESGRFRRDLYYRLNVIPVHLPALRERAEDVPVHASAFLRRLAEKNGARVEGFEPEALDRLATYAWPGNVWSESRSWTSERRHAPSAARGDLRSIKSIA